jgi:hypothetical protein
MESPSYLQLRQKEQVSITITRDGLVLSIIVKRDGLVLSIIVTRMVWFFRKYYKNTYV